jgi:hypothetical protein
MMGFGRFIVDMGALLPSLNNVKFKMCASALETGVGLGAVERASAECERVILRVAWGMLRSRRTAATRGPCQLEALRVRATGGSSFWTTGPSKSEAMRFVA